MDGCAFDTAHSICIGIALGVMRVSLGNLPSCILPQLSFSLHLPHSLGCHLSFGSSKLFARALPPLVL